MRWPAGLKRDVATDAQQPRFELDGPAQEPSAFRIERQDVVDPADGEQCRGAPVESGPEHLKRRDRLSLAFAPLPLLGHGIDGDVPGEWRMIAVVPRESPKQRLQLGPGLVQPDHGARDLRAIGLDRLPDLWRTERKEPFEVVSVEQQAGTVDRLLDREPRGDGRG